MMITLENTYRFAILEHTQQAGVHWDLLLDWPEAERLPTWQTDVSPENVDAFHSAKRIFDHRRVYLDFEGEISGGRGSVRQWDTGTYAVVEKTSEFLIVQLSGKRVAGRVRLDTSGNGEKVV